VTTEAAHPEKPIKLQSSRGCGNDSAGWIQEW